MVHLAILIVAIGVTPKIPGDSDLTLVRSELQHNYVRPLTDSIIMRPTIDSIVAGCDRYTFAADSDNTSYLEDSFGYMTRNQGLDISLDSEGLYVNKARYGSTSYLAGICIGDRIVMINGDSVDGMSWVKALNSVISTKSDEVRFVLRRNDRLLKIDVRHELADNSTVTSMVDNHIGYIRIERFTRATSLAINSLFRTFKRDRIRRIVIDLRANRGGLVGAAVDLLQSFAGEGDTLYSFRYRQDSTVLFTAKAQGIFYGKPLEVLVGRSTASAAEIFALGVKGTDYGYILGDSTFGKGVMQCHIELPSGRWFQYTRAVITGPKDMCIDRDHGTGGLAADMPFSTGNVHFDSLKVVASYLPDIRNLRAKYPVPDAGIIANLRTIIPEHLQGDCDYYITRSIWCDMGQLYWVSQQPRFARWKKAQ